MGNNLHISYDLKEPGKNYEAVIAKIKSVSGKWAKIHKSYWYVNSVFTAEQTAAAVWTVMDASDTVYVVDASNNTAAWRNIGDEAAKYIIDQWLK